jgi:hypothetical protein
MIMKEVKNAGKKLFNAFGLEIRRKRGPDMARASMGGAFRQMYRLGFRRGRCLMSGWLGEHMNSTGSFRRRSFC